MRSIINWKIFTILLVLSLLSVLAVFPYVITLQGDVLMTLGLPIGIILILQLLQSTILFSIAIFVGLYFSNKIDFHLPLLEAYVKRKDYLKILKRILFPSLILGGTTAIAIFIADYLFTLQGVLNSTSQNLAPVWQKLLAALYGGIAEEVLMRLFLMTLLIWIGMKIVRREKPPQVIIIISIIIASIILAHFTADIVLLSILPWLL